MIMQRQKQHLWLITTCAQSVIGVPFITHSQSPQLIRARSVTQPRAALDPRFPIWENQPSQFAGNFAKKRIMVSAVKINQTSLKASVTAEPEDQAIRSFPAGNLALAGRQHKPCHAAISNLPRGNREFAGMASENQIGPPIPSNLSVKTIRKN